MGDPLSPAICIGTCAHLEAKWFDGLPSDWQTQVRFTRYLDDIFMVANGAAIDIKQLEEDFTGKCYPTCLKLEDTEHDRYLECKTHVVGPAVEIQHWNKNHTILHISLERPPDGSI